MVLVSYPALGYDCAGNCLADADGDGICDPFEIVGCQDEAYDNYDATATDAIDCSGLLGCTDDGYFEYDAAAEVDNGSCVSLITLVVQTLLQVIMILLQT